MTQDPFEPMDQQPDDGQSSQAAGEESALQQELDAMKDKYLRALADCQNAQKRAVADRNEAVLQAQSDLMRQLLLVLDDFERTLEAAGITEDAAALVKGVQIIQAQLFKILAQAGLEKIHLQAGDPFDPVHHQAVAQQPSDAVQPHHILHVAQAGYMMRDRILRPAAVVVAKATEQSDD